MSSFETIQVEKIRPVSPSGSFLAGPSEPDFLRDETLADLFRQSARLNPDQTAIVSQDGRLTYRELDALSDLAAGRLCALGAGPGRIVGLWLPRGRELLVLQLAIVKAGAAWLPFDADTPPERIAACLEDAAAVGLVSCDELIPRSKRSVGAAWLSAQLLAPAALPSNPPPKKASGQDPAYVIYTSGSTGQPKGVPIAQASICHFLRSENSVLQIRREDVVCQAFSAAFDMSLEEVWISYLVGATLWVAPPQIASDPVALSCALLAHGVTVLHTVPTMLSLFPGDVPGLRIINLGGEKCPEVLVSLWNQGTRRLFNSYGPTETTVSASVAELTSGQPVTIGTPLPNCSIYIVDPEAAADLRLMPAGETGELCISGPGVAAGYLHRVELTKKSFHRNPWQRHAHDGRLYRTGDLARIDADGALHCLGRVDDQIKLRGYRIELGEIEAALTEQPGVAVAAVVPRHDHGFDQIVAFLVREPDSAVSSHEVRAKLAARLPSYMVPSQIQWLAEMPRLTSGKIDRKSLKQRALATDAEAAVSDTPDTAVEKALFSALGQLFAGQSITRGTDFFSDLGGHSLLAARLTSMMRREPSCAHMAVQDVYKYRTVGAITAAVEASAAAAPRPIDAWVPPSFLARWRCGIAQLAALPFLLSLRMAQWLAPFFAYHYLTGSPGDSVANAVVWSVGFYLLATTAEFAVAILGKWVILGRVRPGRYPLWGWMYFRWWLVDRLLEAAPTFLISGSTLQVWWLRALGAKIGAETHIGSITLRVPELLCIGEGASIGNAVNIENAQVFQGELLIGSVTLGAQSRVGSYAVLEGDTRLGDRSHLDAQSALGWNEGVPPDRKYAGSPAQDTGPAATLDLPPPPVVGRLHRVMENVFFVAGALLIAALFFMPVFPTFMLIDQLDTGDAWLGDSSASVLNLLKYFFLALPASGVMVTFTALLSAALRWGALPRIKAGRWPIHSRTFCAKWLVNQIQESSLQVLHGVYATVYAPMWYRLLGAKIGRGAEISTALGVVPDMLTLGEDTFIADAVLLGDEEIHGGWMTTKPTVIGRRSFIGNGSYVPDGTNLPDNVLIGVLSATPDPARVQSGDTWVGSPPIHLPARETVVGFAEALTFRPSAFRRIGRGLVEAFRIVAPHAIVIAAGYTIVQAVMPIASDGQWLRVAVDLAVDGLIFGLCTFVFVAAFKWLLVGRYQRRSAPMWTPAVWISEAATNLYEGAAVPNFMRYLRGTPWLPIALNVLGCSIGRGVYLDTTDITEFDCVSIGDHAELNALVCPQTHLFEDRIMKIDHVRIGARVNVGPRSTVLYGGTVGEGAQLGPLTLVMKGEEVPPASRWRGNPAQPTKTRMPSARATRSPTPGRAAEIGKIA